MSYPQGNHHGYAMPQTNIGGIAHPPQLINQNQDIHGPQQAHHDMPGPHQLQHGFHPQMNADPNVQHMMHLPPSMQLHHSPGSSFSVISNQAGSSNSNNSNSNVNGFVNVFPNNVLPNIANLPNGTAQGMSMTDLSLEKAMEKVQELASENSALREYLKENNENMKKQFQTLLQWKEKVQKSNKQNLHRFEQLRNQISQLKSENEKYRQCLQDPERKGSVLEDLQRHVRKLEEEKRATQREMEVLHDKIGCMNDQIGKEETVLVNTASNEAEMDTMRRRCTELSQQVYNFHQQNEQLMQDVQHVNSLKLQIQAENNKLHEDNLDLQKKLQSFLGDMNKTKYSLDALKDPNNRQFQYHAGASTSTGNATENSSGSGMAHCSSTAQTDIEILAMQSAVVERMNSQQDATRSGDIVSELEEELKGKLQLEKDRTSKQSMQMSNMEVEISRLQSQLGEKEQMLGHYKGQLDTQIAHMTLEHRKQKDDLLKQLDNLNSELQQTKSSVPYMGDVQNLKSQVMSLIQENQELSSKLEMTTKNMDKKSGRIVELQEIVRSREQSQLEMNNYIQAMKTNLSVSEDTINKERSEHATTKRQLMEFRGSFNRLVNDYKELLDTFDEYKASQQQQQTGSPNKQQMEEINRLTAQTIAAEEAITFRDEQIKQLKTETLRLKDEVDNTIPVLRAQAEVWKQDFDAERYARERQVEEKNTILQEMKNLELKNQQLIDEIESYSQKSLAEMQKRHAAPTYHQQIQNRLQGPGLPGGAGGQMAQAGYQQQAANAAGYPGQQGGGQFPQQKAGGRPGPVEHGTRDESAMPPPVNPPQSQPHSHSSGQDEGEAQNQCPKCGILCPDMDTLQIHIIDCLDN